MVPITMGELLTNSIYGVSSVVVAQLSVKQLDRVRFPLSPQRTDPRFAMLCGEQLAFLIYKLSKVKELKAILVFIKMIAGLGRADLKTL